MRNVIEDKGKNRAPGYDRITKEVGYG